MKKWTRYMLLMSVLFAQALTSCSLIDEPTDDESVDLKASLALNVSVNRSVTRMSDAVTQQIGQVYRGIQDIKIFPFDIKGAIGADATPLEGMTYDMQQYEAGMNYYDNHTVTIPDGTASFLCYAKAVPENEEFENGSISPTWGTTTSTISFVPKVIQSNVEVVGGDKIATYLTQIANAIKNAGKDDFFREFINEGHLVACSSKNVLKLAAWVEGWANDNSISITLPTMPSDLPTDYPSDIPSDILLPDGAAVVQWQKPAGESAYRFVPQTQTTPEANINSLNRFIYPAELWYYANSRIMTSVSSQINHFSETWESVLSNYEVDNGVMDASVHSVAIKDPLSYAVGCLQIGLVANSTLSDAGETPTIITLSSGTFPLKAVFVSGQYRQKFNFTPDTNDEEKIIYDPEIKGISMGDSQSSSPSKWVNTLVLQTQDQTNVRFALEFENNSGHDFQGADGRIFKDTKFYLVGTIEVPSGQTEDWKKRAFTKNYITQGIVRINSLQQAYPYLPDLLDPRLEIAVKLVPNWIQSTTTNVPL